VRKETFNLSWYAIGKQAQDLPDNLALELIGPPLPNLAKTSWSYKDLDQSVRAIAGGLINKGLRPGDFVLLRLNSDVSFALSFFGAIAAGLVPVPLSPHLTNTEIDFFVQDTGAKWMIHAPNLYVCKRADCALIDQDEIIDFLHHETSAPYAQTVSEDPAFLIYTSGTTNQPKGVLHAQRVILGRIPMREGWHDMEPNDRVLHAGDFNWSYTLGVGLMDPWAVGATALIYHGEKSPALWPELIETHNVTIFAAVPGVYRQILKYGHPNKQHFVNLRLGLSAGEALPEALHEQWQEQTGGNLYEAMGQSEISTYVSTAPGINVPSGAKGRIQKGRKVVILSNQPETEKAGLSPCQPDEQGLIAVHTSDPGLMLGYWQQGKDHSASVCGEWFLTGDLGSIDGHQNLTHYGRADEVMNASGYRVSPHEVEKALLENEHILEAGVFENQIRPDLSIIEALLVLKPNQLSETAFKDQLVEQLSHKLALYKHPKAYHIVSNLPRNKTGKLIRKQLQDYREI